MAAGLSPIKHQAIQIERSKTSDDINKVIDRLSTMVKGYYDMGKLVVSPLPPFRDLCTSLLHYSTDDDVGYVK